MYTFKVSKKALNSAFSYARNKRHVSARTELGVLLYRSKSTMEMDLEMELRSTFLGMPYLQ